MEGDQSKWNAIQRLIDPNFKLESGNDARHRKKKDRRAFGRRGKKGKNRFVKKKRDNQDRQYENQWYLLANKCQILCDDGLQIEGTIFDGFIQNEKTTKYLIPENSKVDFYLQVHGIYSENAKLELIKNIKKLDRVVSAYEICINDIASKENLIIK